MYNLFITSKVFALLSAILCALDQGMHNTSIFHVDYHSLSPVILIGHDHEIYPYMCTLLQQYCCFT
jgi:hypothetical protein